MRKVFLLTAALAVLSSSAFASSVYSSTTGQWIDQGAAKSNAELTAQNLRDAGMKSNVDPFYTTWATAPAEKRSNHELTLLNDHAAGYNHRSDVDGNGNMKGQN